MHAIYYKYAPASFNHTWTLNHECNPENNLNLNLNLRNDYSYSISYPRIELLKKSPFYTLPKTWNDLNVKAQHSKTTFSIALKDYLLESADH